MALKFDGWRNLLVGIGRKQEKANKTTLSNGTLLSEQELNILYLEDGMSSNIVDIIPNDMTREWIDLEENEKESDQDSKDKEIMEEVLNSLNSESIFNLALKWKRLYGGALIFIHAVDGQELTAPIVPEKIREMKLKVIPKYDIEMSSCKYNDDLNSPYYGEIEEWAFYIRKSFNRTLIYVHRSRVMCFYGKPVSASMQDYATLLESDRYFGISEIQAPYTAIRDFGATNATIMQLLYELVLGKYKFDGLANLMSSGNEKCVQERIELVSMQKSVFNAIILDKNDEFIRDQINLTGLDVVINHLMFLLSGMSRIPATKLFGRSPAGMNATGESDLNNYYDEVRSKQKLELLPTLNYLCGIIFIWKKLKNSVKVKFNPLFQQTEKEKAETDKIEQETESSKANMYKAYIDAGVLDADEVYKLEWQETLEPNLTEE